MFAECAGHTIWRACGGVFRTPWEKDPLLSAKRVLTIARAQTGHLDCHRSVRRASFEGVNPALMLSAAPFARGDVAQLGEHRLCKPGVGGSSPLVSTLPKCRILELGYLPALGSAASESLEK